MRRVDSKPGWVDAELTLAKVSEEMLCRESRPLRISAASQSQSGCLFVK